MSGEFSVSSKIKFGEFIIKGLVNGNSRVNVSLNVRERVILKCEGFHSNTLL